MVAGYFYGAYRAISLNAGCENRQGKLLDAQPPFCYLVGINYPFADSPGDPSCFRGTACCSWSCGLFLYLLPQRGPNLYR
jgi:hypothetical protein